MTTLKTCINYISLLGKQVGLILPQIENNSKNLPLELNLRDMTVVQHTCVRRLGVGVDVCEGFGYVLKGGMP